MENERISISDLKLRPTAVLMLNQHGYETVADLIHLCSAEVVRLPGMGGNDWRKLVAALGRKPYSQLSRRKSA